MRHRATVLTLIASVTVVACTETTQPVNEPPTVSITAPTSGTTVTVGEDTILAGQVGIAGSSEVGKRVTLAGQVGVAGHLSIGDGVIATAQTGIPSSVEEGAVVSGYPAIENRAWLRSSAVFTKLPDLQKKLRQLERRLESLIERLREHDH